MSCVDDPRRSVILAGQSAGTPDAAMGSRRMTKTADSFIDITIDGRIAIVRFDRGTKSNALSVEALRQLTETARGFHGRPDISAVVLPAARPASPSGPT